MAETMNTPKIEEILKALEYEAFMWRGNGVSAVCLDAADLITQLQQELSKLKEQHRWIPATERLPEDFEDVLIVSSRAISLGCYDAGLRCWVDYVDSTYDVTTHWMPLPKRPEEDE